MSGCFRIKKLLFVWLMLQIQLTYQSCREYINNENELKLSHCLEDKSFNVEANITNSLKAHDSIYKISIIFAEIKTIPLAICHKSNLRHLILYYNELDTLSKECFKGMTDLEYLEVYENPFKHLEDGIFDNLSKLQSLSIRNNELESIGDLVFNDPSKQPGLSIIDLSENKIKSVDSWPWIRSTSLEKMSIDLSRNQILNFTNRLNWIYKCKNGSKSLSFKYNLRDNPIDHLSNFFFTVFPKKMDYFCFLGNTEKNWVKLELDNVRILCDCIDFPLVSMLKNFRNSQHLNMVYCKWPQHLNFMRVLQVPDDQFQCDISNQACVPGCRCIQVPGNLTFVIDCTGVNYPSMPLSLPPFDIPIHFSISTKYELQFQSMGLESIQNMEYLLKTKILNLGYNKISQITKENMEYLIGLHELYLEGNYLTTLPAFDIGQPSSLKRLSLFNNPWDCSCDTKWFKGGLPNISSHLSLNSQNVILCVTPSWLAGRNIFTVDSHEFCSDPFVEQRNVLLLRVLLPIAFILLLCVVIFLLLRRFKVQLNTYLAFHPFDRDECHGEFMEYDVFISSSYFDREFAIKLVNLLEDKGYRVCYHEKDFIGGQPIALNICHAVWCSKRVLCVVTKAFLDSHFCMYEFEQALQRNIRLNKQRLVVLFDESLMTDSYLLPLDIKTFVASYTYVAYQTNKAWIQQLLYSMTINKLNKGSLQ